MKNELLREETLACLTPAPACYHFFMWRSSFSLHNHNNSAFTPLVCTVNGRLDASTKLIR